MEKGMGRGGKEGRGGEWNCRTMSNCFLRAWYMQHVGMYTNVNVTAATYFLRTL